MNNMISTKRTLVSSVVALVLCFTMLIGTTYAWFTDSVTSSGNIIKTGTLDVAMTWSDDYSVAEGAWHNVDTDATPIFGYELWEPAYTAVRYIKVENLGTLSLKYKLQIVVNGELADANGIRLSDVIDVYYAPAKVEVATRADVSNLNYLGTLTQFISGGAVINDALAKNESDYATLVLKMQETAGNEYQGLSVGTNFDIMLFAAQDTVEGDSFGIYDGNAQYPAHGTASGAPTTSDLNTFTVTVMNEVNTHPTTGEQAKLATFVIPVARAEADKEVVITVTETNKDGGITLQENESSKNYEITVENLKPGTEEIEVTLRVGADKNVVALYHNDVQITNYTYDSYAGNITFKTSSFSPFTVVFSDEAQEVTTDLPQASINNITAQQPAEGYTYAFVGTTVEGLTLVDAGKLEAVYEVKANDTLEEAKANKYADWKCDFFVKVNKDIDANSIILAGQYDQFLEDEWVAFSNPEAVEGETYIPLLLLVSNGWTYEEIVNGVGTFYCGVKAADDSLAENGVIFTVQLRLVNPEASNLQNPAEGEYVVVDEISYNFATGTSSK